MQGVPVVPVSPSVRGNGLVHVVPVLPRVQGKYLVLVSLEEFPVVPVFLIVQGDSLAMVVGIPVRMEELPFVPVFLIVQGNGLAPVVGAPVREMFPVVHVTSRVQGKQLVMVVETPVSMEGFPVVHMCLQVQGNSLVHGWALWLGPAVGPELGTTVVGPELGAVAMVGPSTMGGRGAMVGPLPLAVRLWIRPLEGLGGELGGMEENFLSFMIDVQA